MVGHVDSIHRWMGVLEELWLTVEEGSVDVADVVISKVNGIFSRDVWKPRMKHLEDGRRDLNVGHVQEIASLLALDTP